MGDQRSAGPSKSARLDGVHRKNRHCGALDEPAAGLNARESAALSELFALDSIRTDHGPLRSADRA